MDLMSMNRKELQALCKEHGIPANAKNSQMIESLSSILQGMVKPKGCLKGSGGSSAEDLGVFRGGSKKVTFVIGDGEKDGGEEFVVNPVGKSKRKSVGRRSRVAAKLESGGGSASPESAIEVPQRTTRSRGLAEAVLWSPGIEKKVVKKSGDGTEGVRQNAKEKKGISVAVPSTRSLRNRVVTVGGDEEVATDRNPRRTWKRKYSAEEDEKVAALKEDEAVGRINLRKRSRDAESVDDEPPRRRSTRSHVKLEGTEAVEEVDVGRSRKRRKGGLEVSVVEKVVDEETERVSKPGGNAKRLKGNGSGDANDSEGVPTSTRRSTRNSSALLEDGNFTAVVGKSDREADASGKGKSQKQAKARASEGGDSVNLLTDSQVLAEPVRRSTRSSSTLPKDGTSLPAIVKSVKGGLAVKKRKSLKQAKNKSFKGGNTTNSLPDREAIAMPIRRSARSSSSLLENGTSIPVVGKSVEDGEVATTPTRRSTHGSSKLLEDKKPNEAVTSPTRRSAQSSLRLLEVEMPNNEAVTSPTRRSMRSSLKLLEDKMPNYEAVNSPTKRSTRSSSKLLEDEMPNNKAVTSPMRRLTHGSSKLMEDEMPNIETVTSSTGKSTQSSLKLVEAEMPKNEAVTSHTKRTTHSSSKLFKEEMPGNKAVSTLSRRSTCSSSKQGGSTGPLQYSEAVTPARRLAHSSSKLVADEIPNKEAVAASTKRLTRSSLKLLEDEMLNNESVATPTKRSVRSSSKVLAAETSLPVVCKLDVQSGAVRNDDSDEILGTNKKNKRTREVASKEDAFVVESEVIGGSGSRGTLQVSSTSSQRKSLRKVTADSEVVQGQCSPHSSSSLSEDDMNVSEMHQSLVNVQLQMDGNGTSVVGTPKDLEDVCFGSHIREKHSPPREMENTGRDLLSLNLIEGSSDIQENVSGESMHSNIDGILEAEGPLELYGDVISKVSAPVELTSPTLKASSRGTSVGALDDVAVGALDDVAGIAGMDSQNITPTPLPLKSSEEVSTFHTQCSTGAQLKEPDSAVEIVDREDMVTGYEEAHVSSPQFPCKSSAELSPTFDTEASPGIHLEGPNSQAEIHESSEELSTFHTECSTGAQLKEPDSAVEIVDREDMVTGYEEAHVSSPQFPCKSSAELSLTFDTEASPGIHLEGPNSQAEIHDSTGDALEGNEATDIREPTFVTEASPVTDLKELDSNVEVEGPSEDVSTDSGATKIIDPMTSNSDVCPNAFCDINAEEFDAKVEVHVTSKGGVEGTDNKSTAGSPLSCKSTGVLSPTLLNEVSPDTDHGESVLKVGSHDMNQVSSHSIDFLNEASDNHNQSKTLKVSMTTDWDALYLSDIQRMFDNETENCTMDNETENCTTDQDSTLNAQSEPGECDIGKKVESPPGNSYSLSCEVDLEVVKETWVSSTLPVTVNEGIGTEEDKNDTETNGDEGRPYSSSENPSFDPCSGDLMKEHGTQSSEEIVDHVTALCSHGNAKQSDFTQSLCEEDSAGIDGKLRDPFDDKFCEDNNDHFLSPVAFVKPEDNESSHYKIGVVSSEIREENWNDEHGSSIQLSVSGSRLVKQMEKEDRFHDADLKSTRFSASANENSSPMSLGYEGSTKQVGFQDFPCVPDNEDSMHLSDQQEVTVDVTESLDVDSADRSPKSTPKTHDTVKPLSVVADILSETADTANEHTDMEFERSHELGALVAEETGNVEFLESDASIEGGDDTVMKKADSIGQDKFDRVGQQQDEAYILQETKPLSGEHHTVDIVSHPSVENSASMPETTLLSLENFDSSTHMENESNDDKEIGVKKESRLPCNIREGLIAALSESNEEESALVSPIKPESTSEATMIGGQHTTPSTSMSPPPDTLNCKTGNIREGLITALGESNEEERVHVSPAKPESTPDTTMIGEQHTTPSTSESPPPDTLNCNAGNIREGLIAALGESNEEESVHVSPAKPESTPEATMIGEQHTTPSTSESPPPDTLNCNEVGLCKESSFGGANSVDIRDEDNDLKGVSITNNDNVELEESSDLNTIIASSKTADGEHGVEHCINISCGMTQGSEDRGISENIEGSPATDSSPKCHAQDEESNRYQGKLESFVQASGVEATWATPGGTLMFVGELFHMDSHVASSVNDSAPVGQLGHHGENLAHGECGNFLEEAVATQESEMKAVAVSESSVAKIEEAGPYECGMSSENFSGDSARPCTVMDSQATHSAEQSEAQEGRRVCSQETLEVSKDTMFAPLDGGKIEGSAVSESKFEEREIMPLPRVDKQELITKNFTEVSVTNVADQVLWDHKESMESKSVGNELEDSKFRETVTAQHAFVSLDAGAAGDSSTAMQVESAASKDVIMASEEYFEDFGWSFADTFDVDSSHQEVQAVDSQLPMESRTGNSADHSSKTGIDVNPEQSNNSELDQIEESKECVQSTPMQLVRNFKPYSVIDDAIKNKENTVGLKMDSTRKHNDKSAISNSSRQPLQSVRRDKDEH